MCLDETLHVACNSGETQTRKILLLFSLHGKIQGHVVLPGTPEHGTRNTRTPEHPGTSQNIPEHPKNLEHYLKPRTPQKTRKSAKCKRKKKTKIQLKNERGREVI